VNFGTVKVGKSKSRVVKLTNTVKKKTGTAVTFAGATVAASNVSHLRHLAKSLDLVLLVAHIWDRPLATG
jgi:hypothetical protein